MSEKEKLLVNALAYASLIAKYSWNKSRENILSIHQTVALLLIIESGVNGIYQKDLVKKLRWSDTNVLSGSRYLGKLLDLGLIERRRGQRGFWICYYTKRGWTTYRRVLREFDTFEKVLI